jgi:hypothetical protein
MVPRVVASFAVAILLLCPLRAHAQEATLTGTVTDSTGAVLPGVTVTATNQATGNVFSAVTDGTGRFRLPVRVGTYRLAIELSGFTTVTREGVELLVGQTVTMNAQMRPSTVQETVTVTGEAPLIETTSSSVGGNIDPRQMSELPVQGREWMSLALLAPGNRTTEIGGEPVQTTREDNPDFSLNLDGQQVGNTLGALNQPRYSRDTIAEFEFVSNRFDATQGRSPAAVVNAITKSGTNNFTGLLSGYFRDSDWNAEDPVLHRKVPFKNQQLSTAAGGPIVKDRLHYFGNFEYDRTPLTTFANTPYPAFNVSLSGRETVKMGGGRADYEISPSSRFMLKGDGTKRYTPFGSLGSNHPAQAADTDETSWRVLGTMTNVLSNSTLNEIKLGESRLHFEQQSLAHWSNAWQAKNGVTAGHPIIRMRGFAVAGSTLVPRYWDQRVMTVRDDFTTSYTAHGRHDVKLGGEFLWSRSSTTNCVNCMGVITARGGPVPANIQQILPDPFNVDTWNLAALTPIVQSYQLGIGRFYFPDTMPKYGAWLQDDWQIASRLTLNLGVRYDLLWNAFAQNRSFEPWMAAGRPQDADNIQPRAGFAFTANDRTVFRGGAGLYYADVPASALFWAQMPSKTAMLDVAPDGRADFAANPFNGPAPTLDQALQRFCYVRSGPGCLIRNIDELPPPPEHAHVPRKFQSSIGLQRQFGSDMALTADYVYSHGSDENVLQSNVNATYDPATGLNRPFADRSTRIDPNFGLVGMDPKTGWSNYHALQAAFTKRFSRRWQGSATYTLSGLWNGDPLPLSGLKMITFPVQPDIGNDYSFAVTDQRHRLVFNGIWQVGGGLQVSGVYFYGSGERMPLIYGDDLRGLGEGFESFTPRLRPDGTLVPRNGFVGEPVHRVDMRFQERIPLGGHRSIDGMLELFNIFNRANYGSYVTDEASSQFGQPEYNANLAYAPRTLQLGFRLMF